MNQVLWTHKSLTVRFRTFVCVFRKRNHTAEKGLDSRWEMQESARSMYSSIFLLESMYYSLSEEDWIHKKFLSLETRIKLELHNS